MRLKCNELRAPTKWMDQLRFGDEPRCKLSSVHNWNNFNSLIFRRRTSIAWNSSNGEACSSNFGFSCVGASVWILMAGIILYFIKLSQFEFSSTCMTICPIPSPHSMIIDFIKFSFQSKRFSNATGTDFKLHGYVHNVSVDHRKCCWKKSEIVKLGWLI